MPALRFARLLVSVLPWVVFPCTMPAGAADALVPYRVVGDGIPAPLTDTPGDPRRGRVAAANSTQGKCAICHPLPIAELPVFGNLGPPLDGVGARLTEAQLRLRIVDAKRLNPQSIMPAYYHVAGLRRVAPKFQNQPMLSAQEIEDVVAYLATLK